MFHIEKVKQFTYLTSSLLFFLAPSFIKILYRSVNHFVFLTNHLFPMAGKKIKRCYERIVNKLVSTGTEALIKYT